MSVIIPDAINGIDVSSLQTATWNPVEVAKAGFEFVYIQSSRYSSTREGRYRKAVDEALAAGLKVGAYHFCSHDTDPVKQAAFFYEASAGLGSKPGELPPMADWEFCTASKYKDHPNHCVDWIEAFLDESNRLWYPDNDLRIFRRSCVVYTYPNYAGTHRVPLRNSKRLALAPLCYASYHARSKYVPNSVAEVPFHSVPEPWKRALLVQYSGNDSAPVPGVAVSCDRQVFTGSSGEWQDFCGLPRPVSSFEGKVIEDEYQKNTV